MAESSTALPDAIVLVVLGTILLTYAVLLLTDRNRDRRVPWFLPHKVDLVYLDVNRVLTVLGTAAVVWGGISLERWAGEWLALLVAIGPTVVLRFVVLRLHHRRLAITRSQDPGTSSSWRRPSGD